MNFHSENSFLDEKLINSAFIDYDDYKNTNTVASAFGLLRSKFAGFKAKVSAERFIKSNFLDVWEAQIAARGDGGLVGSYQWDRLKELAELHQHLNFSSVLELGTGGSSKMFSNLVGSAGTVIALEESEYWLGRTKDAIGSPANVEFIHANRQIHVLNGEIVVRYGASLEVYERDYDLVYIDGPTTKLTADEIEQHKGLIPDTRNNTVAAVDVEMLLQNGKRPKAIVVDGKRPSVRWLFKHWQKEYALFTRSLYLPVSKKPSKLRYHCIFLRRDVF